MNPVTHPTDGESAGLLRDITHELGHIIALADYFCGSLTSSILIIFYPVLNHS